MGESTHLPPMCPGVDFRTLLHIWVKLFCFAIVSSETKRIYFDFRVNNSHSAVQWPIKIEFVTKNLNIIEMRKQTCEHMKLKYTVWQKINVTHTRSKVKGFDHLDDFGLD